MSNPVTIKTKKSEKVILKIFYASWSGTYLLVEPVLQKILNKNNDLIEAEFYEIEKHKEKFDEYKIYVLPTLIFTNNDEIVEIIRGAFSEKVLIDKLNSIRNNI